VRDNVLKACQHDYLTNRQWEFHKIYNYNFGAAGNKDKTDYILRSKCQRSRSQRDQCTFFRRRHTDLRFDVNQRPVCPRFCLAVVCLQSCVLSTWNPQTNNLVCVFFVLTTF